MRTSVVCGSVLVNVDNMSTLCNCTLGTPGLDKRRANKRGTGEFPAVVWFCLMTMERKLRMSA